MFCHQGHQLPTLFLLGAQKCATTSFIDQLVRDWDFDGGHGTPNDGAGYSTGKEHHFFENPRRNQKGLDHYASGVWPKL